MSCVSYFWFLKIYPCEIAQCRLHYLLSLSAKLSLVEKGLKSINGICCCFSNFSAYIFFTNSVNLSSMILVLLLPYAIFSRTILSEQLWDIVSVFIVTLTISFLRNFKTRKSVSVMWGETKKVFYLIHLRLMFLLWRNHVLDLHWKNIWKTTLEEWNFI